MKDKIEKGFNPTSISTFTEVQSSDLKTSNQESSRAVYLVAQKGIRWCGNYYTSTEPAMHFKEAVVVKYSPQNPSQIVVSSFEGGFIRFSSSQFVSRPKACSTESNIFAFSQNITSLACQGLQDETKRLRRTVPIFRRRRS